MNITFSNHKKILTVGWSLLSFFFFLFLPVPASADDDREAPRKVVVGTVVAPPLCMKTADSQWEGLSIEIWQAVAQRLDFLSEFREYTGLGPLMDAMKNGEIDVIPFVVVEDSYESAMDFSQSYLKSGLAIAVPAESVGSKWVSVVAKIFSKDILDTFGLLILMCLTAGIIVWLFERRRNSEMFGDGTVKGIAQGI